MIKLVAFDVDGVLTDGGIIYDETGKEYKIFNVKDGQGIVNLNNAGIITAIITARQNGTVEYRAKNLNIKELHQGVQNKLGTLNEIIKKYGINYSEVAYIGDDLPDIPIIEKVGLSACPFDAVDEVKSIVSFQTRNLGGHGAVREFCDYILKEIS